MPKTCNPKTIKKQAAATLQNENVKSFTPTIHAGQWWMLIPDLPLSKQLLRPVVFQDVMMLLTEKMYSGINIKGLMMSGGAQISPTSLSSPS